MAAAQRSVPAPFLTKTYQLVDDASTDDVVSWNEDGTAFVVWKTAEFAKDLLPQYFKHNNFSSFIRQLNTYGFRKVVPDKWEFANGNFRQGQEELLSEIRRRKVVAPPSQSNSAGEDLGSSSTSSPGSKNPGSVETAANMVADLSEENEKLRRENETLSSELAAAKRQRDELVAFLSEHLNVGPDNIDGMVEGATRGKRPAGEEDSGDGGGMKLFGVWLKGERRKRGREGIKNVDFNIHPPLWKTSNVCL
ncbi:PREDICTED: heat stress transcription factor B-1 [Tarenaya hassleriana]|uniref:heat stress transcription factor B-1 n=1 Tax=Tarenaya hassleriana TaxID=28532 RepID=UPI00053C305C|nr:PREDICTED: heat stress transcription factor B-1 [Tarenaya hassleriana]